VTADTLQIAARIVTGGAFLILGLRNIGNHAEITGLMRSRHIPLPAVSAAAGIAMQIVFGALLATQFWPLAAALGLSLFVIMATAIAHSPFTGTEAERKANVAACLVNAIMLGGLLSLAAAAL
jgi:putative oxidoreductase